jgi:hypothetical protein
MAIFRLKFDLDFWGEKIVEKSGVFDALDVRERNSHEHLRVI